MRLQCNNPLTKEPKLSVAMRLLPEWTQYDQEIRDLQERVARPAAVPDSTGHEAHARDEL